MARFATWAKFCAVQKKTKQARTEAQLLKASQQKLVNALKEEVVSQAHKAAQKEIEITETRDMLALLYDASHKLTQRTTKGMQWAREEALVQGDRIISSEGIEPLADWHSEADMQEQQQLVQAMAEHMRKIDEQLENTFAIKVRKTIVASTSQTLLSCVGGDKEKESQTEIGASDFTRLQNAAAKGYAAEARELMRRDTDTEQEQQTDIDTTQWNDMEAHMKRLRGKEHEAEAKERWKIEAEKQRAEAEKQRAAVTTAVQANANTREELDRLQMSYDQAMQRNESLQAQVASLAQGGCKGRRRPENPQPH